MNIIKFYDEFAESYDKRHSSPATRIVRKKELAMIKRFSGGRVLDIGCGTGYHMQFVKNAVGIDPSREMLKIARRKGIKNLKPGRAENLPFRSNSFDTVLCFFAVLNMCSCKKAVREMERVLKEKGKALISVSSINGSRKFRIHKREIELYLFSKKALVELFRRNGFRLIYFDSVFRKTKPRWGDFTPFSLKEKIMLFLEKFSEKEKGEIYFFVFEKNPSSTT